VLAVPRTEVHTHEPLPSAQCPPYHSIRTLLAYELCRTRGKMKAQRAKAEQ
jgi:hypothetical protein